MAISMAVAALLLSFGFSFAASLTAYFMGGDHKPSILLTLLWLTTSAAATGFAFLAGNLWS